MTDVTIHGPHFHQYTGFLLIDALLNGNLRVFFDVLRHVILPAVTLCIGSFALMVRVMRSSMLEELGKDYVRTARPKDCRNVRWCIGMRAKMPLSP